MFVEYPVCRCRRGLFCLRMCVNFFGTRLLDMSEKHCTLLWEVRDIDTLIILK